MMQIKLDFNSLSPQQILLAENNIGLVPYLIKRHLQTNAIKITTLLDFEDYYQIGMIFLYTAAKYFDSSKYKFSTYACSCISRALIRAYDREENASFDLSLEVLFEKEMEDTSLVTPEKYKENNLLTEDLCAYVKEKCQQFYKSSKTEKQKENIRLGEQVLLLQIKNDYRLGEVAKKLNISKETAKYAKRYIMNKLNNYDNLRNFILDN